MQLDPQVGTGLQLDPRDAPADGERVGQAEPAAPALDDLAAAPAVRVEAATEVRQLGLVRVSRDVAGEAVTDEPAGPSAGGVVLGAGGAGERSRPQRRQGAADGPQPPQAADGDSHNERRGHDQGDERGGGEVVGGAPRREQGCDREQAAQHEGNRECEGPTGQAAVGEPGSDERRGVSAVDEQLEAVEPLGPALTGHRQDLAHDVVTQRRLAGVARVGERVGRVELVPVLDLHAALAAARRDHQVRGDRHLGVQLGLEGPHRRRVPGERAVVVARQHDDSAIRTIGERGQRADETRVGAQRPARIVATAAEQLEGIPGKDDGARSGPGLHRSGQLGGDPLGRGIRIGAEVQVAGHEDPATDGYRDLDQVGNELFGCSHIGTRHGATVLAAVQGRRASRGRSGPWPGREVAPLDEGGQGGEHRFPARRWRHRPSPSAQRRRAGGARCRRPSPSLARRTGGAWPTIATRSLRPCATSDGTWNGSRSIGEASS